MTDGAHRPDYSPAIAKNGDGEEASPLCGTCLGAQGEWLELNGKKDEQHTWAPCTTCRGTGRT
ncbi:hypothetical protein GCM10009733_099480 [Nonomuraea maheshkhaliensis]|uniref:Uncharacterized protein n=1 Tax=Nonomuraea maheshkhaliensis TaxID=419590 RepID=A0ABN2HGA5_9ACTN